MDHVDFFDVLHLRPREPICLLFIDLKLREAPLRGRPHGAGRRPHVRPPRKLLARLGDEHLEAADGAGPDPPSTPALTVDASSIWCIDPVETAQRIVGSGLFDEEYEGAMDANHDGVIDCADVVLVVSKIAEILAAIPPEILFE